MQWAEIENGIIKAIKASQKAPEGVTILPNNNQVMVGESIKSYNKDWMLRPLSERVAEGLVTLHKDTKLDGEQIVPMTEVEKIEAGIEEAPEGMKVDGGELVPMSIDERVEAGEITIEEGKNLKAEEIRNTRDMLLSECDYIFMPDYPLDDKSQWGAYRQKLRDITEQPGFPDEITWPVKPAKETI